jgi:hypothetical protein
VPAAAFKS